MPDDSLEILVRTTADTSGLKQTETAIASTESAIKGSAAANEQAAGAVGKHAAHMRGLHQVCHALNEWFPV